MREPLSERQQQALDFIERYLGERQIPPTLQEIGDAIGIRSSNGVFKLLNELERKGHIERERNAARAIRLVEDEAGGTFSMDPVEILAVGRTDSAEPEGLRQHPSYVFRLDPYFLHHARDPASCLVLRVADDAMKDDGIRENDLVLVEEIPYRRIDAGTTCAVALKDRIVVRVFTFANLRIHLHATSRRYPDETYYSDDRACHVIGPVLSVFRRLD